MYTRNILILITPTMQTFNDFMACLYKLCKRDITGTWDISSASWGKLRRLPVIAGGIAASRNEVLSKRKTVGYPGKMGRIGLK